MESLEKILKERGWCQGATLAADGRVCLMGAIWAALAQPGAPLAFALPAECADRIYRALPGDSTHSYEGFLACGHSETIAKALTVTSWNDHPRRSPFEVLEVARKFDALMEPKSEDKQAVEALIEETAAVPAE